MFLAFFDVMVFVYGKASGLKKRHVPFFVHFGFLQSPRQSFILPSYAEAFALVLADLCSIPPSPKPRTYYHHGIDLFIDDEAKEASV
jgi:hypothetical protein